MWQHAWHLNINMWYDSLAPCVTWPVCDMTHSRAYECSARCDLLLNEWGARHDTLLHMRPQVIRLTCSMRDACEYICNTTHLSHVWHDSYVTTCVTFEYKYVIRLTCFMCDMTRMWHDAFTRIWMQRKIWHSLEWDARYDNSWINEMHYMKRTWMHEAQDMTLTWHKIWHSLECSVRYDTHLNETLLNEWDTTYDTHLLEWMRRKIWHTLEWMRSKTWHSLGAWYDPLECTRHNTWRSLTYTNEPQDMTFTWMNEAQDMAPIKVMLCASCIQVNVISCGSFVYVSDRHVLHEAHNMTFIGVNKTWDTTLTSMNEAHDMTLIWRQISRWLEWMRRAIWHPCEWMRRKIRPSWMNEAQHMTITHLYEWVTRYDLLLNEWGARHDTLLHMRPQVIRFTCSMCDMTRMWHDSFTRIWMQRKIWHSLEWMRRKTRHSTAYEASSPRRIERWGAGVEAQKNVRGEIGGWGRVPFNETYAPSLSTIYDGA